MTKLMDLADEDIYERAQQLHRLALQGDQQARDRAAECVAEARQRFARATTLAAGLEEIHPISKRAWWRFW